MKIRKTGFKYKTTMLSQAAKSVFGNLQFGYLPPECLRFRGVVVLIKKDLSFIENKVLKLRGVFFEFFI